MAPVIPKRRIGFAETMQLEKLDTPDGSEKYISKFPALTMDFVPGGPLSELRSYGGHALAQAMWAASIGLGPQSGYKVHEANAYWIQPGYANRPYIYTVSTLSQTRSFTIRVVSVHQPTTPSSDCPFPVTDASKPQGSLAFSLTCSFKLSEPAGRQFWTPFDCAKYGDLLKQDISTFAKGFTVQQLPGVDGDVPAPRRAESAGSGSTSTSPPPSPSSSGDSNGSTDPAKEEDTDPPFAGLQVLTPNLEPYNAAHPGPDFRRVHIYRCPDSHLSALDANIHAAAHAYASDRAGLLLAAGALGEWMTVGGSLNHKILFHVEPEELALSDGTWYVQEMGSSRAGRGRVVIETKVWDMGTGRLVVSSVQDMLFRTAKVEAKLA